MTYHEQIIQITLPQGKPNGIHLLDKEDLGLIGIADIPRQDLADFLLLKQSNKSGIYFLLSPEEVYIGQSANLGERIKNHDNHRPFWRTALACFSLKENFETTELLFLEQIAIAAARQAKNLNVVNGNSGNVNAYTSNKTQRKCRAIFEEMKDLIAVAKYDFFTPRAKLPPSVTEITVKTAQHWFYCRRTQANAKGYKMPDTQEFVIVAGSLFLKEEAVSCREYIRKKRADLIAQNILVSHDEQHYRLTVDLNLSSPSTAAELVCTRPSNGWVEWKDDNGNTLDQIYRIPNT